ncbi:MAG: glutamate synthase subunit beta, partial [Proteobacteria bacterium]|nr:glutamate synthase subunit beta [Pseudomonadota bacterium]
MGKITGFLEIERHDRGYEKPDARLKHYNEFIKPLPAEELNAQAARCMDCGIPFCHNGCPVNNQIPDWNNLVYREHWRQALVNLQSTNNFPEFTGRICPAPCEASCTLNIDDNPVTIKTIECAIVDRGWAEGWIKPQPPTQKTGKKVAVVGSGPAGMACAQQLARAGHDVVLIEKNDRIGGLLRYGIPDFKMEKHLIDRRMEQMAAEGVTFKTGVEVGKDVTVDQLLANHDAAVLSGGAEWPRNLDVNGRELDGIHYAMDFLTQQNKRDAGDPEDKAAPGGSTISAKGKHVIVIGGGDTGSDCIGTSLRQGAASVTQIEIMPKPPVKENKAMVWPDWPTKLRSSHAHEEGCERDWSVLTKRAVGDGKVEALECVRVDWERTPDGRMTMKEVAGSEFQLKADLVLLAMGFLGPKRGDLIEQAKVELDARGNVLADTVQ